MLLIRRGFLEFLAASPLLAQDEFHDLKDMLSVMDFEAVARVKVPTAHWGYMATGVDDDRTLRANREAMDHYQLRARRLSGVVTADLKTEVFGATWDTPIYLSAVGGQKGFHPEGEVATARASRAEKTMQMLSTVTSTSVEDVARERGAAPWYQLYMPPTWAETEKVVRRVEAAGCPVLVWTVDTIASRNAETSARFARTDKRDCLACHATHPITGSLTVRNRLKPMFAGLSGEMRPPAADWTYVNRLKKMTPMKVLIKGIDVAEDAALAREHGADGVIVSNHGGRATETGRGTMDILPEVLDAVKGQIPVFVDGGFRRGSDVFKALALGAKAVGIGRPYVWGLGAFGQPGVERVLQMLRAELQLTMQQCGTGSVAGITRAAVLRNGARV